MKFGYFCNTTNWDHKPYQQLLDETKEITTYCDENNWNSIWYTEHHFNHEGMESCTNPLMMGVDAAARTKQIRIGQACNVITFHNPIRLAEDIALLDQLSNGRVEVGIGRGIYGREAINMNKEADLKDQAKNFRLFDETLTIMKKAWTEEFFSHKGEFYTYPSPNFVWQHDMSPPSEKFLDTKTNEIKKILSNLGFTIKSKGKFLNVKVPSWRPDIFGEIDLVEEVIRIIGFEKIKSIEPEKKRTKPTLNFFQKHFHLAQRSVASKGYLETITWSFTDEKINNKFKEKLESVKIVNPISSDLNVLRNSLYPNLIFYLEKNLNRGFGDQALFEIGPTFTGKKPGQQITVVCGIKKQFIDEDNNLKKNDLVDVFHIKKDLVQSLTELEIRKEDFKVEEITPS